MWDYLGSFYSTCAIAADELKSVTRPPVPPSSLISDEVDRP